MVMFVFLLSFRQREGKGRVFNWFSSPIVLKIVPHTAVIPKRLIDLVSKLNE